MTMDIEEIYGNIARLAEQLVGLCKLRGVKIAAAESCTGGMISAAVTSVPGSSAVIELGVCSYSNEIKNMVLGVDREILEKYSEYSAECAKAMAQGALNLSGADFAVSVTGVAGPSGGSEAHPVGEVFIGISGRGSCFAQRFVFSGSREMIRAEAAQAALRLLLAELGKI